MRHSDVAQLFPSFIIIEDGGYSILFILKKKTIP